MKKLTLFTAVGAALLASASVANAQLVDIFATGLPATPADATNLSDYPDTAIGNITNNDADITATIEGVVASVSSGAIDRADAEINDNSATAAAAGNNATNLIDLGDSGEAPSNIAIIANANTVTGGAQIGSRISEVSFVIDGGGGNISGDSDLEINGTIARSFADANVAENAIVGNFDDLNEAPVGGGAPLAFDVGVDGNGWVNGEGNFVIANLQYTQGNVSVTSEIDDLTISIMDFDTTGSSGGGFPDSAEITNSEASTRARGNTAFNTISGQNDGDENSFGIASLQLNSADISATTTNVEMSIVLDGSLNRMGADISDNRISAAAAGNVVVNHISFTD